jgi:hypothetical protein
VVNEVPQEGERGGLSFIRVQKSWKEVEYVHKGHRAMATTFFSHSGDPSLADNVLICLLAEMWKHIQVGETDGRDEASVEKQGNRRICAHWMEKGGFTLSVDGRMGVREKRERTCCWVQAPGDVQPP